MKKSFKLFLMVVFVFAAVSLCSCDLIDKIVGDLETATESQTESQKESVTEASSVEETSETSIAYTKEYFVGVWKDVTARKTTMVVNEDGTLKYYRFGSTFYDYNKGIEGTWSFDESGTFFMSIVLGEAFELYALPATNDLVLTCSNSQNWSLELLMKKEEMTAADVELTSAERCSILLPDGVYVGTADTVRSMKIEDGVLTVYGDLREYLVSELTVKYGDLYGSQTGEFNIPIAKDCAFLSGGGEGGYTTLEPEALIQEINAAILETNLYIEQGELVGINHHQ